jgi:uncharacterized protein (TIGR00369 family)
MAQTGTRGVSTVDDSGWGEARSKTVQWHDPSTTAAAGATLSGIDFLRAIRDGVLPPPPIATLLGMQMREVEPGRVVFECEPDESSYNPIGVVHGGLVCTLADTVAACAVHTTLEVGVAYTSIDLNVSYLRPVTVGSGVLRATGLVTKPGRRVAFSSAEIVDGAGKLVATATSSCLVMDARTSQPPGAGNGTPG